MKTMTSANPRTGREYLSEGEFNTRYSEEISLIDLIELVQATESEEAKDELVEHIRKLIHSDYNLRELRKSLSPKTVANILIPK
jgi:L-fucose isomerase-like protein